MGSSLDLVQVLELVELLVHGNPWNVLLVCLLLGFCFWYYQRCRLKLALAGRKSEDSGVDKKKDL